MWTKLYTSFSRLSIYVNCQIKNAVTSVSWGYKITENGFEKVNKASTRWCQKLNFFNFELPTDSVVTEHKKFDYHSSIIPVYVTGFLWTCLLIILCGTVAVHVDSFFAMEYVKRHIKCCFSSEIPKVREVMLKRRKRRDEARAHTAAANIKSKKVGVCFMVITNLRRKVHLSEVIYRFYVSKHWDQHKKLTNINLLFCSSCNTWQFWPDAYICSCFQI